MGLTVRELRPEVRPALTPVAPSKGFPSRQVPSRQVPSGQAPSGQAPNRLVPNRQDEAHAWYALMVKHQHERPLESALRHKGFEALAPFYKTRKRWSDRVKEIDLPLFPGYVFCRFRFDQRIGVLDTPGISRVVSFNGHPAPVSGEEIEAIRTVMAAKATVRPWPHLKPGDRVRIERGALRGIEGILLREKEILRLVIGVGILQRSVAVEIDADCIGPVGAPHAVACAG